MIGENSAESIGKNDTASTVVSAVVSSILVLILVIMATVFIYIYGRRNPGGWAEKIALRLETPYKRFGILDENENSNDQVEMGRKPLENNNNNNNTSSNNAGNLTTTVAFWDQKTNFRKYILSKKTLKIIIAIKILYAKYLVGI